jgi:pantoate--beta-alanine ligase
LTVEVIKQAAAWRERLDACRSEGRQVKLVPTMGALHAGHMSLIRRAAGDAGDGGHSAAMGQAGMRGVVAVTDYVNPLQFGAGEDLAAYPRDLGRDVELAAQAGAHLVFAPTTEELWPDRDGSSARATTVRVEGLTARMEGERRPGHFDGVTTIVAKLFHLTGPCWAYFGEKDFQQLAIIRRMAADLSMPVEVIACPTVRDSDGLALSSRNAYLTPDERRVAPHLYYALLAGKRAIEDDGVDDPEKVRMIMADSLAGHPQLTLDYADVADPERLVRPERITREVRLFIAARLGRARLIDNLAANPPTPNR